MNDVVLNYLASQTLKHLGIACCLLSFCAADVHAQKHAFGELSLERWSKMREVERHQMQIAEKYFREGNWKVAAAEYDKYLSLYETSDAASYSMLKWSVCQVKLRKQNTAINDGFRSVIDYWPDGEDAILAAYHIGKTYQDIGQTSKAKPALSDVAKNHPKHLAGVYSMVALSEIAESENDDKSKVLLWRQLSFDAIRNKQTQRYCNQAAEKLASHQMLQGDFDEAVKAIETAYSGGDVQQQIVARGCNAIVKLFANSENQAKANSFSKKLVVYLRANLPDDTSTEEAKNKMRDSLFMVSRVYRAGGNDAAVERTFAEIEKRCGADDSLLGQISDWHRSESRFQEARATYRKFANTAKGLSGIASTFRQEKNWQSAVATFEQLATTDTNNRIKWRSESATTYREFRKYDAAIAIYQELLKDDVASSEKWLWEIACCYRDDSKWKEAIGFFRQTDRFPSNYQEMARCHRRMKQYGEAIALYNQIAGGHKASAPWALVQIGYTQEEAKSKDKAISAFKKVCKLFPKDRYASVAHAHLQNKYKLSVTLGGAKDE